jgi:hypothetical protein
MSKSKSTNNEQNEQQFYHGTKAQLTKGDLISAGFNSNYGKQKKALYVYLAATLDAAIWGAELAMGDGPEKIYIKPVQVHHFIPGGYKVFYKLVLCISACVYTSATALSSELDPNTRSARVPVHLSSPVARSLPS